MLSRLFLTHPRSVDESYLEHAGVAAGMGLSLLGAAAMAFVHALLPFCFTASVSRRVAELYATTSTRNGHVKARQPLSDDLPGVQRG